MSTALAAVALADPKNTAVNNCVNSKMDAATGAGNWNDSGHMDSDYRFDSHSIRAFLNDVRGCLKPTYDLNINDLVFINACLTAQVYRLKRLVYNQAKP